MSVITICNSLLPQRTPSRRLRQKGGVQTTEMTAPSPSDAAPPKAHQEGSKNPAALFMKPLRLRQISVAPVIKVLLYEGMEDGRRFLSS